MLTRIPIKVLAPLLFGVPVLAIGLWLSFAWNHQAQRAITQLADQDIEQIHQATATRIADLLSVPVRVSRLNQYLITSSKLPPDNLAAWRPTLVRESQAFDVLSAISWGSADGRTAWISRYADGSIYWALKEDPTQPLMNQWKLDLNGDVVAGSRSSFDFQLSSRPWFLVPSEARQATWSEPYLWVGGDDEKGKTLGISYGIPLFDGKQLLGVIDADFSLNDLSSYLSKLKFGKTGMAILISPDHKLLAASNDTPIVQADGQRVFAADSTDPLVATVGKYLQSNKFVNDANTHANVDGTNYYFHASGVGEELGLRWTLVTIVPEEDFIGDIQSEFARSWSTSLVAVVLAIALGFIAASWLVEPLTRIVSSVRRIGQGDLDTRIEMQHAPEYTQLATAINAMAEGLQDRMRMQKSLSLAMEVQRNLLPAESPSFNGLDIAGHSTYCDDTGGDYFDFLDVSGCDQDTAVIVIGDVMGHGVAAALLMATARGILRSRCAVPGSLADFLQHLNDMLVVDTQGERFMTMLLVNLSAKKDTLRWASAGHGPPIIYTPEDDSFAECDGGGLPLGLVAGETYSEYWQPGIKAGTILLATTDGLEETMNEQGHQYGKQRLQQLLRDHASQSAEEISQAIRQSLASFRGANSQDDDLTFVVAKVL
ncbi:SpoIIE family protein phosphatase [Bremerella cremea]|nr:SpoIIE family protein phosphatase [Bremerella cremea]